MNVKSVEKLENNTAKLVLSVERAQFQAALDKAYRQVKNDIYIPGFRKGKAPRKIVEGMYGKEVFYEDAINLLFPEIWPDALKESELNVVGNPSIADLNVEENGDLTLTVDAALYPEVTLGQYKGIEAEKAVPEVTEEEIDAEIKKLQDRTSPALKSSLSACPPAMRRTLISRSPRITVQRNWPDSLSFSRSRSRKSRPPIHPNWMMSLPRMFPRLRIPWRICATKSAKNFSSRRATALRATSGMLWFRRPSTI